MRVVDSPEAMSDLGKMLSKQYAVLLLHGDL